MLFLSYRHADASESTDRIHEWLEDKLSLDEVFMDVYFLHGGDDWPRMVQEKLSAAQVMLVIIGRHWHEGDLRDAKNASRIEIEFALAHNIPIIPVRVDNAEMPSAKGMPESLEPFFALHAIQVRPGPDREHDLPRLQRDLERLGVAFPRPRPRSNTEQLRVALLKKVRSQIADGRRAALQDLAYIELNMLTQPSAIDPPWLPVHPEDGQPQPVAPGETLWDILEERGSLLILGDAGSGKTTMLLDVGERLVQRALRDEADQWPIPLYLNLASWGLEKRPLREWLSERLQQDFGFKKRASRRLSTDRLVLLLDGLDEVEEKARSACIEAINTYQADSHDHLPIVVCCRAHDYFTQATRLRVASAIRVQPLSPAQISAFLTQGSGQLRALQDAIEQDPGLDELSHSPLWLNIMSVIYRDIPGEQIPRGSAPDALRNQIIHRYVALRLDVRYRAQPQRNAPKQQKQQKRDQPSPGAYAPGDALRWLTWLAQMLQHSNQSRFYLESLQPHMARRPAAVRILYLLVFGLGSILTLGLIIGLVSGLVFGLIYGPAAGLYAGLIFGAAFGISAGVYIGIIFGLVASPGKIKLKDRWRFKASNVVYGLLGGVLGGLAMGLFGGVRVALVSGLLVGIVFGLMFSLVDVLQGSAIAEAGYLSPYTGMRRTGQNGLIFGLLLGLLSGIGFGLVFGLDAGLGGGLLLGAFFGFLSGLLAGILAALFAGLGEYMKHWLLRWALVRQGAIPSRYLAFLNFATDRTILRQVGNGFEFIHPLLRSYFATRDTSETHPPHEGR
jgi:hypothetical protein